MRTLLCGVAVVAAMAACATNAFAQTEGAQTDKKEYALFQVGVTTGAEAAQDPQQPKLAVGADFGHVINRHVEMYVAGGWQEEAHPALSGTTHLTSGVKLVLLDTFVRPYIRAGAGVLHFQFPEPADGTYFDSKIKFLTEVGGGVAFPVGTQGYIDIGYRYFKPYNAPGFTPNGLFAGFGIRY